MSSLNKGVRTLPLSIAALKERSAESRERLIRGYLCANGRPVRPPYLESASIAETHLQRSALELADLRAHRRGAAGYHAYTLREAGGFSFSGRAGALSEVCVGVMGEVLKARGELQVAAGFFSTMVACVDDYIDREGSYGELGERLIFISHCYRDLMDMALDEQVSAGQLSEGEVLDIKIRLADVMETLAGSEDASDAHRYLYEKSCGDKVIGVLFPASGASVEDKSRCAEIGRLVGEAGQLIDDIIDFESDMERGGRNYISQTGSGQEGAIEGVTRRVSKARGIAGGLRNNGAVCWVLDALDEVACLMEARRGEKEPAGPGVFGLSASFKALVPDGASADTFLIWF